MDAKTITQKIMWINKNTIQTDEISNQNGIFILCNDSKPDKKSFRFFRCGFLPNN